MKNVKILFAALVMFVSIAACAPNHEEVIPSDENMKETPIKVKSTDGGTDGTKPTPPSGD